MIGAAQRSVSPRNERLRELVQASGLYRRVIAQRAGIRPDVLSQLISGSRPLTWNYVARLAPVFGVPMEAFAQKGDLVSGAGRAGAEGCPLCTRKEDRP